MNDFVVVLFFGGGTNMVDEEGHANDFSHEHGTEDPAPGCPACKGEWDDFT